MKRYLSFFFAVLLILAFCKLDHLAVKAAENSSRSDPASDESPKEEDITMRDVLEIFSKFAKIGKEFVLSQKDNISKAVQFLKYTRIVQIIFQ